MFNLTLVVNSNINNKLAKTIAVHYKKLNRSNKDKLYESLLPLYNTYSDSYLNSIKFDESSRFDHPEAQKDFRMKSVRLANVRGIGDVKNNLTYGFDLVEDNIVQNAVFLGPNGTGKSSIFSAIEYIYAQRVAEKDLRTLNPGGNTEKEFIEYLEHFNTAAFCEIETVSGTYSIRNKVFKNIAELKSIYPENHFISDYDIYRKGQINYVGEATNNSSFHHLIASSLGLQEYLDFTNDLKSLSGYRRLKETNKRKDLNAQQNILESEISKNRSQVEAKLAAVNSLKLEVTGKLISDSQSQTLVILASIRQTNFNVQLDKENYHSILEKFNISQDIFIGLSVNPDLQSEAQFLTLGLELLNFSKDCPLCGNSKSSIGEIKKQIESRISEIKEYQIASKNLQASIEALIFQVREILSSIEFEYQKMLLESEKLSSISNFDFLFKKEKEVSKFLKEFLTQLIPLGEGLDLIERNRTSVEIQNQQLSKLLKENEVAIYVDLPNIQSVFKNFQLDRDAILTEVEKTILQNQHEATPQQTIAILESEISNHNSNINLALNQIHNIQEELQQVNISIETLANIKDEAAGFSKILEREVNALVSSTFETIKETITTILSDYLLEENVSLDIRLLEEPEIDDPDSVRTTIVAEIRKLDTTTGEIIVLSPSKYFNTFRYRLFSMMVTLSIAISARKNSGINMPIVLDDVFYASDYNSKTTFRSFILNVLDIFRKHNGEMPLQFILFTHDELVFDSALDAIYEFEVKTEDVEESTLAKEWLTPMSNSTCFARLFPVSDIDQVPNESHLGKFWDITYKLPSQIQVQLLNIK